MLADTDGNGVSDYNQCYGISTVELPSDTSSTPAQDSDGDGLDDSQESSLGTNPYDSDTDDDGLTDGFEASWGSSPTNSDSDNDGALIRRRTLSDSSLEIPIPIAMDWRMALRSPTLAASHSQPMMRIVVMTAFQTISRRTAPEDGRNAEKGHG